jgi:hypothetical protein
MPGVVVVALWQGREQQPTRNQAFFVCTSFNHESNRKHAMASNLRTARDLHQSTPMAAKERT